MGFLSKIFGNKESQFQDHVIKELGGTSQKVTPGTHPMSIRFHGTELDIKQLFDQCEKNQVQAPELIKQFFSWPEAFIATQGDSWNVAESQLRPQLVPEEIAKRFNIQLFPFADSVAIAMKTPQAFVRKSDQTNWKVTPEELLNRSIANLDSDPTEMEVTVTDGTDRFIGFETRDGFDAARILLPRVRDFATVKLGETYFAGIPNRDFLILWSRDCSQRFQDYAVEKIETDFFIQNYPLTLSRFEVNQTTIRPLT